MKKFILSFSIIFLLISCTKKTTTPEEINLLPTDNFQIEVIDFTSVKLSWQDISENEEGYLIYKISTGVIQDSISLPENSVEYIDDNIVPGHNYTYEIFSYFEDDFSYGREESTNTFPVQIENLDISVIDSVTAILTWNDNCNFEHGFKIDKSLCWDNWNNEVAVLDSNSTEWTDNLFVEGHNYYYRVYPFCNEYIGEKTGFHLFDPLPLEHFVELTNFNTYWQNDIVVNWTTETEIDCVEWHIYRGISENAIWNNEANIVNSVYIYGSGTTFEPTEYQYIDDYYIEIGQTYYYWLDCKNSSGFKMLFGPMIFTMPY